MWLVFVSLHSPSKATTHTPRRLPARESGALCTLAQIRRLHARTHLQWLRVAVPPQLCRHSNSSLATHLHRLRVLVGGAQGQVECKLILFYNLAFCVLLSYLMGSDMRVLLVWTALWPVIRAIIAGIWVAWKNSSKSASNNRADRASIS